MGNRWFRSCVRRGHIWLQEVHQWVGYKLFTRGYTLVTSELQVVNKLVTSGYVLVKRAGTSGYKLVKSGYKLVPSGQQMGYK